MNKTRGHRRYNSYSYTASGNDQFALAYEAFEEKLSNSEKSSCSEAFLRSTERRSYRSAANTSKARHQGYKAVSVKQALPATIKFSTSKEESDEMSRPRSPSKTSRMEIKNVDHNEPVLDNALAAIREQLAQLKKDRTNIISRMATLTVGISEACKDLSRQRQIVQRSPGQPLRRIQSLDGHSQSYSKLPQLDMEDTDGPEELTASSPDRSPYFVRRDSLPSKALNNTATLPTPPILAHRASQRAHCSDVEWSTEVVARFSPTFSQVSPIPEAPPEVDTYFNPESPMLPFSPCSNLWQKLNNDKQYYTLPIRRSSTPTNHITDTCSIDNTDNASLQSEASLVLQISSATGQLEQVPRKRASSVKFEYNKLKTCPNVPVIMKLSEEPFSQATLQRRQSQLSYRRSCVGMETAV